MYLDDLRKSLVEIARNRVRSGRLTERGLAKACGLSQPHMHNVLKNVRTLSIEAADRLLAALEITATDLFLRFPFGEDLGTRAVPVLRSRIGPGITPNFNVFGGYLGIPAYLAAGSFEPVLARIAPDLSLAPGFEPDNLILLDQTIAFRNVPRPHTPYVVVDRGSSQIRYVKLGSSRLFLAEVPDWENPDRWPSLPLAGMPLAETIRARVVWVSRELSMPPVI